MDRPPPSISLPDDGWADVDGDGSRLLATLILNGCELHVEAYAAGWDGDVQTAPAGEPELTVLADAVGADGPWRTAAIRGREYVLVATPYGE